MSNLKVVKTLRDNSDQAVVETLEEALKLAKEGTLKSVALVGSTNDGRMYARCNRPCVNRFELIGACEWLKNQIAKWIDEERE